MTAALVIAALLPQGDHCLIHINRDSPDESQTGINVRVFPALLQDRREVLPLPTPRVTRTLGRGSDLAIFPGIWTHSFCRLSQVGAGLRTSYHASRGRFSFFLPSAPKQFRALGFGSAARKESPAEAGQGLSWKGNQDEVRQPNSKSRLF